MTGPAAPPLPGEPRQWWEGRPFAAALILLSVVPLLYPQVPPLVDLFGHMGRYRVQLDLSESPWLPLYYDFEWAAIGNLGVDLLIIPLAPVLGLEMAVKLIVLAIPPLTVAGFLLVAREVHQRLPPTALFALPFVYGHPFLFGFVNYALSMALAFLAFGLWLRLARLGKLRLRALLFVPISIVIFFTHTYGWGALGLLCFSAEAVRQHDGGKSWYRSIFHAALHASVMALPLLIMVGWRSEAHGGMTRLWFHWERKWEWVHSALRDRWRLFDWISLAVVALVFAFAVAHRRLTLSRNLAFSALVLLAGFLIIPLTVFGSTYADMRLVPFLFAVAVLAIRFRGETPLPLARMLAVCGLVFLVIRFAGNGISLAMAADDQRAKLEAIDHMPMGARTVTLAGQPCKREWALPRNTHLGAMVIVRRHGFSNDQWVIEGINLLQLNYRPAGRFAADPSQIVQADHCRPAKMWTMSEALAAFPRDRFDYLWLIDPPPYDPAAVNDLRPVWRGPGSILYQVER
ncbi:MAG TPA: hypothetical protein VNH53_11030 [Sphingomicrobium sp.]|nr:hypothetical protein [Sphingomicrobium sp.]